MVLKCSKSSEIWKLELSYEILNSTFLDIHTLKTIDACSIDDDNIVFFF